MQISERPLTWLRRTTAALSICAVTTLAALSPQNQPDGTSPEPLSSTPAKATVQQLPVRPSLNSRGGDLRLARTQVQRFAMLGVTWARGAEPTRVEVQVQDANGWSRWRRLEFHGDSASGGRPGTDPLWVRSAVGIAVRVSGPARDVRAALIDPGADPLFAHSAYLGIPDYVSRGAWGARAPKYCDQPRTADHLDGVIFHHTAGSNRYARSESARIVRGIQAYHMSGQGWCDIGYNFLVDKFGQVFEGRSGGILPQVRGAHAGNFEVNTYAMGVSMMGNLDRVRPSDAMKAATVRLIGWRLGTNYLPALGRYPIAGHSLNRISGHRDVRLSGISPSTATACPGRYGYRWLRAEGGLRSRVAAYVATYSTPIRARAEAMGVAQTGRVRIGEHPSMQGTKTVFGNGRMYDAGGGAWWVTAPVLATYLEQGEETGALGWPISDASVGPSGTTQEFEHGTISIDPATGVATVTPR